MNNSYLFEKEPMSKHNINLGSTILGRVGVIILFGLAVLSLAGCGGGGGSDSGQRPPNMQIMPPSGDGPDLVIQSTSVSDTTLTPNQRFTLSVRVRNQGNERSGSFSVAYARDNSLPFAISSIESVAYVDEDGQPRFDSVIGNGLDPSRTVSRTVNLIAPSTPGTYYYGVCLFTEDSSLIYCSRNEGEATRVTVGGSSTTPSGGLAQQAVATHCLEIGQVYTTSSSVVTPLSNRCNYTIGYTAFSRNEINFSTISSYDVFEDITGRTFYTARTTSPRVSSISGSILAHSRTVDFVTTRNKEWFPDHFIACRFVLPPPNQNLGGSPDLLSLDWELGCAVLETAVVQ